jgi:hypothetical protein
MSKTSKLGSGAKKYWWIILPMAPIALLIILLVNFSVIVPFWDQWEMVILFQRADAGSLSFMDFFVQHNEHRLLFARFIMHVLAQVSRWNLNYEIATNVIFGITGFSFMAAMLRKTINSRNLFILAVTLLSFIFFSPFQWENWLWGWQIAWFMNVASVSAALWALSTWQASPKKRVVLAAAMGLVAAYSLGSGVLVWLVCLPLLWFNKKLRGYTLPWLGIAAVSTAVYYLGYVNPAGHPSKTLFLQQPLQLIEYLAIYMSRPVLFDDFIGLISIGLLVGLVAGLSFYVFRRRKTALFPSLLPWICLALYSGLAALSTALSRLGFGTQQAYSSRYVTISNLFLIALCVVLFKIIDTQESKDRLNRAGRNICIAFLVGIALLVGVNYIKGVEQMRQQHSHLIKAKDCAIHATSPDDNCLLLLYPNKPVVWERLQYLRSKGWGGTVE